ncbi:MAG: hypothetical protein AB1568_04615 [Thermodesulfobacteriota bacterium]
MVNLYIFCTICSLFLLYGGYAGFKGESSVVVAQILMGTALGIGYAVGAIARYIGVIAWLRWLFEGWK